MKPYHSLQLVHPLYINGNRHYQQLEQNFKIFASPAQQLAIFIMLLHMSSSCMHICKHYITSLRQRYANIHFAAATKKLYNRLTNLILPCRFYKGLRVPLLSATEATLIFILMTSLNIPCYCTNNGACISEVSAHTYWLFFIFIVLQQALIVNVMCLSLYITLLLVNVITAIVYYAITTMKCCCCCCCYMFLPVCV